MNQRTIYVNGRFLMQKPTGVNRYAYELCKALYVYYPEMVVVCPKQNIADYYDVTGFRITHWGWGGSHFWEQVSLPAFFVGKRGDYLLLNFTGIGPVCVGKKVVTIHDLGIWIDRTWYSWKYRLLYKILTPLSVATAKVVLTVSNFSKSEIMRVLGVKEERIEVVYNAIPAAFAQQTQEENLTKDRKYILAVSSIDPRKNFARLVEAFKLLRRKDVELYIVGGKSAIFGTTEMGETSDNIHWLGRVTDEELRNYYRGALAFIYPSLYEGFGIPAIEAMSMGCPVIASDIPVLREVCGDAALYTDPYDPSDMAKIMEQLCDSPQLRQRLIINGHQRIKRYSWQRSAEMLYQVLDEI